MPDLPTKALLLDLTKLLVANHLNRATSLE